MNEMPGAPKSADDEDGPPSWPEFRRAMLFSMAVTALAFILVGPIWGMLATPLAAVLLVTFELGAVYSLWLYRRQHGPSETDAPEEP